MNSYLWKERKWKDADKEIVGSHNGDKERVCANKEKGISIVKRRKGRGMQVHWRIIGERVY